MLCCTCHLCRESATHAGAVGRVSNCAKQRKTVVVMSRWTLKCLLFRVSSDFIWLHRPIASLVTIKTPFWLTLTFSLIRVKMVSFMSSLFREVRLYCDSRHELRYEVRLFVNMQYTNFKLWSAVSNLKLFLRFEQAILTYICCVCWLPNKFWALCSCSKCWRFFRGNLCVCSYLFLAYMCTFPCEMLDASCQ